LTGFGNASGTNVSSRGLSVTVANCPAGGCTISFSFEADPFVMATVDAGANAGSVARGTLGFSVSLTNVATNAIVFNWTPDGSLGGIVGGTETSDPETLNATFAAFPGQFDHAFWPVCCWHIHLLRRDNERARGRQLHAVIRDERVDGCAARGRGHGSGTSDVGVDIRWSWRRGRHAPSSAFNGSRVALLTDKLVDFLFVIRFGVEGLGQCALMNRPTDFNSARRAAVSRPSAGLHSCGRV
jgi:hypothetical protein